MISSDIIALSRIISIYIFLLSGAITSPVPLCYSLTPFLPFLLFHAVACKKARLWKHTGSGRSQSLRTYGY